MLSTGQAKPSSAALCCFSSFAPTQIAPTCDEGTCGPGLHGEQLLDGTSPYEHVLNEKANVSESCGGWGQNMSGEGCLHLNSPQHCNSKNHSWLRRALHAIHCATFVLAAAPSTFHHTALERMNDTVLPQKLILGTKLTGPRPCANPQPRAQMKGWDSTWLVSQCRTRNCVPRCFSPSRQSSSGLASHVAFACLPSYHVRQDMLR